ncbi:class I adenylate-forming enzyme family protein [Streptomyces sp. NPDC088915]|uniref:class I adenylate-forming enzyme family protein n=1 Tax=Streptomyces sp. NPDC088915 TaxID=3365912 RepID=UPI0038112731
MSDAFISLLTEHALRRPDRLAIADPNVELTWSQLAAAVRKRALELPEANGSEPAVAALHRPSDTAWLIDALALRSRGLTVVCFPPAMPRLAVARQADAFSATALIGEVSEPLAGEIRSPHAWWRGASLVHLTSGTTGTAMGVPRSEENLLDEAESVAAGLELSADRPLLCGTPVAHSFASGLFLAALTVGAPTVVVPSFDPATTTDLAERYAPALLCGTPYVFRSLLRSPRVRAGALNGVRMPMTGGAPLHADLAADWLETTGTPLVQEYGLSEGGITTVNHTHARETPAAVGRPLPGVRITVVDEHGQEQGPGQMGRILVTRKGNPSFYVGSAGQLVPVPGGTDARPGAVDTGDLGHLDGAGLLHLTGRAKTLINVAGSKVAPQTVEAALLEHPDVQDAAVIGLADATRGEIVAALVEGDPGELRPGDLADHLRRRLSSFMVPRRWHIVPAAPRTASGKPDLHAIRQYFEKGGPTC